MEPTESTSSDDGFDKWKAEVDAEIKRKTGMISDDLLDVDYRGLFAANDTPEEAADYAIEYSMSN